MVRGIRSGGWVGVVAAAALLMVAGCADGDLKDSKGTLSATPSLLNYGPVALSNEGRQEIRLTNEGRAPFLVTELTPTVPNLEVEGFEPFTLGSGESRTFTAIFKPAAEGVVTGAIAVKTDGEGERNLEVFGLGVKAFVNIQQKQLDFGDVELNDVKVQEITINNPTGVASSVGFVLEGEGATMFSASVAGTTVTLEAGETKKIPVAFKPWNIGVANARLRAMVCDACEPVMVELAGMGISKTVAISPERLNFGRVAVGGVSEQRVTITNNGTQPLTFVAPQILNDPAGVYTVSQLPALPNGQIAPGLTATVVVSFRPAQPGKFYPADPSGKSALLSIPLNASNTTNHVKLPMTGEAGGSCIATNPAQLNFGTVPEGMSVTRRVDVINRCQGTVSITDVVLSGTQGGFFTLGQASATFSVPVGGIVPLKVTYTPKPGVNTSSTTLSFKGWENTTQYAISVPVNGASRIFAPCAYTVTPTTLNFGLVAMGAEMTLGFSIKNNGTDSCMVTGLDLASGTDNEFSTAAVDAVELLPGTSVSLPIKFKATTVGNFSGMAEAWVNNSSSGHITVALAAKAVQGCFALQPSSVDFGIKKLSCGPRTRSILGFNNCSAAVTLTSAALTQQTSSEFTIVNAPTLPTTIAPGQNVVFTVNYAPVDEGMDFAALAVNAGQNGLNTASVMGSSLNREDNTDTFLQEGQQKVDVLFVIDNSGSMMEEQQALGSNFQAFLSAAQLQGIDYHIGVTTTGIETSPGGWSVCPGGAEGGEAGRLFPADNSSPRIITPSTPNASAVFATNTNVGWCHWNEQGLEGAYRALSQPIVNNLDDPRSTTLANDGNLGFLRSEAKLAIIFLSDEEDFSTQPVNFYETFFRAVKGNNPALLTVSAIVGPQALSTCPTASSSGTRYIQLAQNTGGIVESICTQNWAGSLNNLSANTFGPKRHFVLSETPSDPTGIVVKINGSPVTTGWTYDGATNTVVFEANAAPAAGARVEVTYPLGC